MNRKHVLGIIYMHGEINTAARRVSLPFLERNVKSRLSTGHLERSRTEYPEGVSTDNLEGVRENQSCMG